MIETVIAQHFACYRVAMANLQGLSDEDARFQPQPGGNSVHWLLRHVISTRDRLLPALGQQALAPQDDAPLADLVAQFGESQERLVAGLKKLPATRLREKAPFSPRQDPNETLATLLPLMPFHESYHIGQIGMVRRLLGKEGILK
jgi:uncharacterized damage-inducible protein DinB